MKIIAVITLACLIAFIQTPILVCVIMIVHAIHSWTIYTIPSWVSSIASVSVGIALIASAPLLLGHIIIAFTHYE